MEEPQPRYTAGQQTDLRATRNDVAGFEETQKGE
jgi:hypothetical protein